ncbi:MAG: NAD-dependent epimerase/dehydratase family protein [Chthoniobacteraceae bacterium]
MAKILTTGGYGFIGAAVAQALVNAGHEVHVLDKYDVPVENCKHFHGSVLDQAAILEAMDRCEYVIHMAAVLGVSNSTLNALECLDVNIFGTRNVLECAVKSKIKKVLFASSSEVYGEPKIVPIPETAALAPVSEYGVSKVVGEEYCKAYFQRFGLPYSIVRLFNVYGERQRDDFVMSVFINAALRGAPLNINGDGSQRRAFGHVEDAADGILKVLFSDKTTNDVVNIGNPAQAISIKELALKIVRATGQPESLIRQTPIGSEDRAPERDIQERLPDISKARATVGFEPRISLDEGIARIVAAKRKKLATP